MHVCINDLSFQGQYQSMEEVRASLTKMLRTIEESKKVTNYAAVKRIRNMDEKLLVGKQTIGEIRSLLMSSNEPKEKDILTLMLNTLIVGPFIKESDFAKEYEEEVCLCGEKVEGSVFHSYMSQNHGSVHAVISAEGTKSYDAPILELHYKGFTLVTINFYTDSCCSQYIRTYEANPKHEIRADRFVDGRKHSKMDLTEGIAQECLNNGFQIMGCDIVYAFTNEQWYEFPSHRECLYHGYPIGVPVNNKDINRIKKVFGNPPYKDIGYRYCLSES